MTDLTIDRNSGYIHPARQVHSPNFDQRPANATIDLIVIHNISLPPGQFGGPWIDALFSNTLDSNAHDFFAAIKDLTVSSHLLIRRDGELVQYVPLHLRAWHAGVSCFQGREKCNDFSLGIELEGSDEVPFCDAQYQCLLNVIKVLRQTYPNINAITGHSDIAPGRKTDPGPFFDWHKIRAIF